jgi:hypothetical protein
MPNLAELLARCQPNTGDRYLPQEWWVYWVDRYYSPTEKDKNALANFYKDKVKNGLVTDADL